MSRKVEILGTLVKAVMTSFIAPSSDGRTADFGSACLGSNPRGASILMTFRLMVGHSALNGIVVVRIHEGQPIYLDM